MGVTGVSEDHLMVILVVVPFWICSFSSFTQPISGQCQDLVSLDRVTSRGPSSLYIAKRHPAEQRLKSSSMPDVALKRCLTLPIYNYEQYLIMHR